MNSYKLFAQRIGLIGLTNLVIGLSAIILLPILTKNVTVEEYGIWAQLVVTIGIVPIVAMLGLPYTMVRFLPSLKDSDVIQETFYSIFFLVLFTSAIASLLIYIFSTSIAFNLFDNNVIIVKILALIVFIECLNSLFYNYFRATQQIKKYSVLMFVQTSLFILLVSFFVLSGRGILGATIGLLIKSGVMFLIMTFFIISEVGFKNPRFRNIKEYLNFGLPTVPGNLSTWVVNSSDRYVIGIFLGTAAVGYYSPGYSLGSVVGMFVAPLSFMLPAVLSKHYDENNLGEVRKILSYSLKYFLALAIPSTFGLSLLSRPLLTILSTQEIASQGYIIAPFVAISSLFFGVYVIISQLIVLEKKTKITGKIWILSAILNIGLNFILIPYMGIIGAAFTTLVAFLLSFTYTSYYSSKILKFDMNFNFIIKSIVASTLMSLIIIKFDPTDLLDVLFTVGVCAITYFVILLFMSGFEKKEIDFFKSLVKI